MMSATAAKVLGSVASVPNNSAAMNLLAASAATIPAARPSAIGRKLARSTSRRISKGRAPSAMRKPISLVRRAVAYETTP